MRQEKYKSLLKSAESLFEGEKNFIANMANTTALIKDAFGFHWVGFYLWNENSSELILGPFQGPLACTRIKQGKGVCGASMEAEKTLVVPDVHAFAGHIACSALSNSEIVVPLVLNGKKIGVLDIDSTEFNDFSSSDQEMLEKLMSMLLTSSEIK